MANMLLLAAVIAVLVGGVVSTEGNADRRELAASNNAFALDVHKALRAVEGNLAVSPLSLELAMTMTWAGARGPTAEELQRALRLLPGADADVPRVAANLAAVQDSLQASENFNLSIANKMYVQESFSIKESFREVAVTNFRSAVEVVNFQSRNEETREAINNWAEQQTHGKIKNLFAPESLDRNALLVLVNAIYFNGNWLHQFDEQHTQSEVFKVSATRRVRVPTMHEMGYYGYGRAAELNCSVLSIPYTGDEMKMLIFLPDALTALSTVEEQLHLLNLSNLSLPRREVIISLPKFRVESTLALKEPLGELGVHLIFSQSSADLSGISEEAGLVVSKVLQKCFVEVTERGTEAAAATAVQIVPRSGRRRPNFRANRPFLFFIVRDNIILFTGRVTDPSLTPA